jgi:tritrans,polycis-undecaprenyl-diphosphate synthase [geranylgeranyl-diphosphate specific]
MNETININHIGIIMDGNRRFSKRLMLKPWKGHEYGAKKLSNVLDWCKEYNIKQLTLYTFSVQNFNRPKKEFDYLMNIFIENFDKLKDDKRIHENKIKINIIGRINMFPKEVQDRLNYIMELTKNYNNYIINFAMAYGGQEEIVDAVKKIAEKIKTDKLNVDEIDNNKFAENLYLNNSPDLIIRTGGEKRTSNFLSFQSAYSEWFFVDKMWPEFEKEDFVNIINEYSNRQRRFGK